MQKVNRTTGDRTVDEDLRRLYKQRDLIDARVSALESSAAASTNQNATVIVPTPSIAPGTNINPVGPANVVGSQTSYAPSDHVHLGVLSFRGTVVLAAPGAVLVVTHNLAMLAPFLVSVDVYSSAGIQQTTALATFVFTTNGVTITFAAPLAADTYSVLAMG